MTDEVNADNQSVAVGGNVTDSTISVGYSQADYEKGLRDREKVLRNEYAALLALADNRTEVQIEKRVTVEKELSVIGEKLANIEASYIDIRASLDEALKTNKELEGLIPAIQLEAAAKAIELGPEAAYEAYDTIVESASDPIARAAFQAAELAKSAIRYPQALKHYRKAAILDDKNPLYMDRLATMYQDMGRYSEAEPLYLKSLKVRKKQLGNEHTDVASSLNNLACLYRSQGRYPEAEPLYLESLKVRKKQLGDEHPDVATGLSNLAGLYESQGHYAEAEPLFLESLAILKNQLGDGHPHVATVLSNLAGLNESIGRHSKAESLYRESLQILLMRLQVGHPLVANSLNSLACLY